jgi:hypothetical protein
MDKAETAIANGLSRQQMNSMWTKHIEGNHISNIKVLSKAYQDAFYICQ